MDTEKLILLDVLVIFVLFVIFLLVFIYIIIHCHPVSRVQAVQSDATRLLTRGTRVKFNNIDDGDLELDYEDGNEPVYV